MQRGCCSTVAICANNTSDCASGVCADAECITHAADDAIASARPAIIQRLFRPIGASYSNCGLPCTTNDSSTAQQLSRKYVSKPCNRPRQCGATSAATRSTSAASYSLC